MTSWSSYGKQSLLAVSMASSKPWNIGQRCFVLYNVILYSLMADASIKFFKHFRVNVSYFRTSSCWLLCHIYFSCRSIFHVTGRGNRPDGSAVNRRRVFTFQFLKNITVHYARSFGQQKDHGRRHKKLVKPQPLRLPKMKYATLRQSRHRKWTGSGYGAHPIT